jgi:hypothetical protein
MADIDDKQQVQIHENVSNEQESKNSRQGVPE